MPAATTHVEMARDVLRTNPDLKENIADLHMFYLGSQGPDVLFFSRGSVMPGSLHKYGNLMHEKNVYKVISFFEKYSAGDPVLTSYVKGYLCHYALDSTMHPLVYAVSNDIHEKTGRDDGEIHIELEAELDLWLLGQRGRSADSYNVYEYLKVSDDARISLAGMYHAMFLSVFGLDIATNRIAHSISDISFYTGLIKPTRFGYTLFKVGEKILLKGKAAITGMMLVDKKIGKILNLDHQTYHVPWKPNAPIRSSVPQLYGAAVLKAQRLLAGHTEQDFLINFNGQPITENN